MSCNISNIAEAVKRHNKYVDIVQLGYKIKYVSSRVSELYLGDKLIGSGSIDDLYKFVMREEKLKKLGL